MKYLCLLLLFLGVAFCREQYIETFGDISLPSHSFSIGKGFDIHYQFEKNHSITLGIVFKKPERFFALGFGKQMLNSDVWLFELNPDGGLTVDDCFFKERDKPTKDVLLGGTNDVRLIGYQIRPDYVIAKVNRALRTGDKFDQELKPGNLDILWAFGDDKFDMSQADSHDHFKASFIKDEELIWSERGDKHGLINLLVWGFLVDVGILLMRFLRLKRDQLSFDFRIPHGIIMFTGFILTNYAASLMIWKNWYEPYLAINKGPLSANIHKIFGLGIVVAAPLVVMGGILTFKRVNIPNIREIHMSFGYLAYILTKINLLLGSHFYENGKWRLPVIMWVFFVLSVHYRLRKATKPPMKERSKVQ